MTYPVPKAEPALDDAQLRAVGFVIAARPVGSTPTWSRRGKLFAQPVAARIARRELEQRKKREAEAG